LLTKSVISQTTCDFAVTNWLLPFCLLRDKGEILHFMYTHLMKMTM